MFKFIKKYFFTAMTNFDCSALSINRLKYVSINNQECKIRSEIVDVNSNESLLYLCSIKINKCRCSCNSINDPYPYQK